jgi:glycosyltransferase involved in cell wall biosynthesis
MNTTAVSIIMPMFNEEKFIKVCIQSIIDQDFKFWELIIVDDFSTDSSYALANSFSEKDDRISVHKNSKKGIIPALQMAFDLSKGEMITRMDADDIMPTIKMAILHTHLLKYGRGNIVSGKVEYFSDGILQNGFKKYEAWINEQAFYPNIYKECTLPSACWMAYREDLKDMGAFQVSRYPEDYDLVFRMYQNKLKIHGIDEVLHLWRDHPARASRNDPHYQDQNFFPLKLFYFNKIDRMEEKPLYLWGAGKKGKLLARLMVAEGMSFTWVTQNEKKAGKHIYDQLLHDASQLKSMIDKQVITAISATGFNSKRSEILKEVHHHGNVYFHFC